MAKKASSKGGTIKSKGSLSASDHRKIANTLQARARLHHAKADLAEAQNPSKKAGRSYPC